MVYYKREGKERWLGPATVVFQNGKVVFVRHSGIFVRVSPNRLRRIHETMGGDENGMVKTGYDKNGDDTNKEKIREESPMSEVVPAPTEGPETSEFDRDPERQSSVTHRDILTINSETEAGGADSDRDRGEPVSVKINDMIKYKLDDEWVTGTILCRAGKVTGRYKTWHNIRNERNEERSVDLGRLGWEKIPETEINIAEITNSKGSESKEINIAKENELEKLVQFETYKEEVDCGQRALSTRLVVRGFEEKDFEIPRDSPTVGKGAMRLFISIAARENWTVKTTDIKSAFLQGKELEGDIYIYIIYIYIY